MNAPINWLQVARNAPAGLRQRIDTGGRRFRNDDDFATFLARELEATAIKSFVTPTLGTPLFDGGIIPRNTDIPEGADSFTYVVETGTGQAAWEDEYASGDLPMVEEFAREHRREIREYGIAWQISLKGMRQSSFAGRGDLAQKKANNATRRMREFGEFVGMYGDPTRQMNGFANHPNVPQIAPIYDATVGVASADWDVKSGDLIQADIVAAKQLMMDTTNGNLEIDRCQVPARVWASLDRPYQVIGATNVAINGLTIKQFIVQNNDEIQFGSMLRLQSNKSAAPPLTPEAPTTQQLSADRVVFYMSQSDVVEYVQPIDPRFQPGQWYELRMKHPGYATTGGTVFYQPNGAVYMDVKS